MIDHKRVIGVLQGCALGDAFGMATEMLSQEVIKNQIGYLETPVASLPISIISKDREAYSITDDTINSLMIFEMLEESLGIVDVNNYINKLQHWSHSSPIAGFVTGPSTTRALALIEKGKSLDETGKMGTTNGAAMKIAPIASVVNYNELDLLIKTVREICIPTHNTSIAISGAAVITAVINYCLMGKEDWNEIWELAIDTAKRAKSYGFMIPCASLEHRLKLARKIVDESVTQEIFLDRLYNEIGCGLETIETVPSSLAIANFAKSNPLRSAQLSAIIGGDTDTLGAISTAICGAINPQMIPKSMIQKIENVNGISLELDLNYL